MQLIRKVHSVGSGAFITEVFEWEGGGFTAVYDCGMGRSPRTPKALTKIVDNAFSASQVINLLFLSHFDNDHINGVEYLISTGHIAQNTKVVLPLVKERIFTLLSDEYQKGYLNVLKSLKGERGELLLLKEVTQDENDEDNDNTEGEGLIPQYVQNIDNERIRVVASNYSIPVPEDRDNPIIWEYHPFYLQDNSLLKSFKQYVIKKAQRANCALSENDLENYQNLTDGQRTQIRMAYKSFKQGRTYKNGPSHINMNSMLLISKPGMLVQSNRIHWPNVPYNKQPSPEAMGASAVYSADVGLRAPYFFNSLDQFVNKNLSEGIGLFQIPHHGSYKNYTQNIYSKLNPDVLFINGSLKSSNPAICADSINDSHLNKKQLYIIDENSSTQLEQQISL